MSKAAWSLVAGLIVAWRAMADPPARKAPPAPAPTAPRERVAVSPILHEPAREIIMPGKGMPKTPPAPSHRLLHNAPR